MQIIRPLRPTRRHGADLKRTVDFPDVGESFHAIEIDDVIGLDEAKVEHRHQRLAAREQLGVFELREQADGLADRVRIVIAKGRRLHLVRDRLRAVLYIHQKLCINPKKTQFPKYGTIRGDRSLVRRPPCSR